MNPTKVVRPRRGDHRIIIHFDYDCFYASVFEAEDPSLKHIPLAVQQKQIIVTCNYEARKQGLHKLQLITTAKQQCPDLVIKLGEDLTRFRNASKSLYDFLRGFAWSDKVEKLGFDEVFLDVTDMIDYNCEMLNSNLESSFFQLSQTDPTHGFHYDATTYAGHVYPPNAKLQNPDEWRLEQRLLVASHLSQHMREALDEGKGYTATVGISTSKLLSKLVGNCNKPRSQTTLVPPYDKNVLQFISKHEVGLVPGIGFSASQKIRHYILQRPADFEKGLIFGATKEHMTVGSVRECPQMSSAVLEKILGGPGAQRGIGKKIWNLLWGVDDTPVTQARDVPHQISIEDSYIRLDTIDEVLVQLKTLATSLIKRMRTDLYETHWIGHPRTLRLTTRPRKPLNEDGTRTRSFARISRSGTLPSFVFDVSVSIESLAEKLVNEALMPLFRKLHPEKSGWNLSLVNVGVTGIEEGISSTTKERDISRMFQHQDEFLKDWKITNPAPHEDPEPMPEYSPHDDSDNDWDEGKRCSICGAIMPEFAMAAHERFHSME